MHARSLAFVALWIGTFQADTPARAVETGLDGSLGFVGVSSGAQIERSPNDDSIVVIQGTIAESGSLRDGPFLPLGDQIGNYRIEAESGDDVRTAPSVLTVTTPTGSLRAIPQQVYGKRDVDPTTGTPLAGAFGGEAAFEALCAWNRGTVPFDPLACSLTIFNSDVQLPPADPPVRASRVSGKGVGTFASLYANMLVGNSLAQSTLSNLFAGAVVPLVFLNVDPCDSFATGGCPARGEDSIADAGPTRSFSGSTPGRKTLNQTLGDAQEALLGCGLFWDPLEADCEYDGVSLVRSEAGALLEAFLLPAGETLLDGTPRPGTIGFAGEEACGRADGETFVRLPGCRGPADPGYDPFVDGCTGPGAIGCESAASLVIPAAFGDAAGQAFRSEISALSWNFLMMLVAFSRDASLPPALDRFDSTSPYSIADGQCSFAQPQHCYTVAGFVPPPALPDDPAGGPLRHWPWQLGAEWRVEAGDGDFAGFDGAALHHFGPIDASSAGFDAGIGLLLVPEPEGSALVLASGAALSLLRGRRRSRTA